MYAIVRWLLSKAHRGIVARFGTQRTLVANHQRGLDHLSSVILDAGQVRTPGGMGLRDVRLIEAIYRSAREGRPLPLNPDGTVWEG